MTRKLTLAIAGLMVGLVAALAVTMTSGAKEASADQSMDSEETAFVVLINNYRAQNGLGPLTIDWKIQPAADWMSWDMGQAPAYFSHTDRQGRSPWDRMCQIGGYCYNTWKGENIAAGFTGAQAVFDAWKNSPGHNANMLGPNYTVMGLARVNNPGSPYGWYWTNDFGGTASGALPPGGPTITATPTPSPTASPSRTPSPSPSRTPSPSPSRTPSPSPSRTPSPTPSRTPSPTPVITRTPTPTPVQLPIFTKTPTPTPRPSTSPRATVNRTPTPTVFHPTPTPVGQPQQSTPRATRTPVNR